jgi:hypothetical protein
MGILSLSTLTSCNSLEIEEELGVYIGATTHETTTATTTTAITTTEDVEELIEFQDYTVTENDDNTYSFTISQEATTDCYYTISLMYDDRITEYVSGDNYIKSAYGEFADDEDGNVLETTTPEDGEEIETEEVTTIDIESLLNKKGEWTFKTTSEGTQYIEIKLINSYGDIVGKYQLTCIVDTHLEPHMYYTNFNY